MERRECGCHNNCDCIKDILNVIFILQQNACKDDPAICTCDKPFLGPCCDDDDCEFNTRPVMLFTDDGKPWKMPFEDDDDDDSDETTGSEGHDPKTSSFFRIEKIEDNCATFRVLVRRCRKDDRFKKTNSFFTINLCCICAIKCMGDTFIEGIC